jgi:alkylation response protein AidB-like acyl-CoA dehydrogenase
MDEGDERNALIRHTTRQFADAKIRPIACELDASERFPEELYREMGALGLFGITIPQDLGGAARTVRPTPS